MFRFLKKKLRAGFRQLLKNHWVAAGRDIPQYALQEKHIGHLQALPNRQKLLELLPKDAIVAELGVNRGDFSALILQVAQPAKLHLIDTWEQDSLRQEVEQKFAPAITEQTVILHAAYSTVAADHFEDNYFDWIYLDTDHSYATTKAELEKYSRKVKPVGLIAGHDFIVGNWNGSVRYGVIEAVNEFCLLYDWELVYLTLDQQEFPSFAIRRLTPNS